MNERTTDADPQTKFAFYDYFLFVMPPMIASCGGQRTKKKFNIYVICHIMCFNIFFNNSLSSWRSYAFFRVVWWRREEDEEGTWWHLFFGCPSYQCWLAGWLRLGSVNFHWLCKKKSPTQFHFGGSFYLRRLLAFCCSCLLCLSFNFIAKSLKIHLLP